MKTLKLLLACFLVLGLVSMLAAYQVLGPGIFPEKGKAAIAAGSEGSKLAEIKTRKLKVGVRNADLTGFIKRLGKDPKKRYEGMDPDFARAIAVAIFGTADPDTNIEWIEINADERFSKLTSGDTDVTLRTCTWTSKRDLTRDGYGFAFGPVYFYDGSNVLMAPDRLPVGGMYNISCGVGLSNCDQLKQLEADGKMPADWNIEDIPSDDAYDAFMVGSYTKDDGTTVTLHGVVGDGSILSGFKYDGIDENIPGAESWKLYFDSPFAKSPLAALVKEGDENWAEVVSYVFHVLVAAEEEGYTTSNLPPFDWGPTVPGLATGWARNVINKVGNYKEIWDENLGQYGSAFEPRGINELRRNGGLFYPPPFVRDAAYPNN
jgi:general L-amino acid transport system substrate-binding protein